MDSIDHQVLGKVREWLREGEAGRLVERCVDLATGAVQVHQAGAAAAAVSASGKA